MIAVFFIGPFLDPVRNEWVLKAGLIACLLVIPLALICGPIRGIPFAWRLIDCSLGVFGAVRCCIAFGWSGESREPGKIRAGNWWVRAVGRRVILTHEAGEPGTGRSAGIVIWTAEAVAWFVRSG